MWRRLLARLLWGPAHLVEEGPDRAPLQGLAAEASMLLAAFEGISATDPTGRPQVPSSVLELFSRDGAEIEARLDNEERGRWMRDAHDWAVRAIREASQRNDPYRGGARIDVRLRTAGLEVKEAVEDDRAPVAAGALKQYLDGIARHSPE